MSRPRSSNGYGRPKSNSSHGGEVTDSAAGVVSSSRAKSSEKSKRQIVGQYMIGKTIGEGTFGKVKLAVHIPTGEKVAIKILEKSRIKEQADVRRVNREIKILKKTRHGNIIQLYEVLDTKNTIYLIMECCEGGEMFDYIVAQKRVAEPQACKFFHQIIDGIEVLHKNEITHRDLKPENLLLKNTSDGWVVKIVDFGLSNTHEGGKLLATACGSPCYAAPEMIAGKKYFGPLADLWSIGVILFALVSGYLPFEDANTSVLYKKILSGDYTCPKWLSPEVKDLIQCILEVDPKKRYTVDNIRRHPWYTMVPESAIPRDLMVSTEASRAETLMTMSKAGLDTQAVLDGVASQAFNGLTAMYYLLEQKYHARQMKKAESSKTQIRQNSSNLSKPETGSDTNDTSRKENAPTAAVPVGATAPAPQQQHAHAVKAPAPVKLMNIEPLAPIVHQPSDRHKDHSDVPIKTYVPTTPYLQTPAILQQHQAHAHHRPHHSNMPSLDLYLKGGVELPTSNSQHGSKDSGSINGGAVAGAPPVKTVPNQAGVVIPPLNLRAKGAHNATSAAVAAATGNSLFGTKLTSQTARGPGGVTTQPGEEATVGIAVHPYSARGPLPTDIPMDLPERPNTRRSRLRSRSGEPHQQEMGPGQDLTPALNLGDMDAIPPTKETSPQMPVRRPEPSGPPGGSASAAHRPRPAAEGTSGAAPAGSAGVDGASAAMSLLVISQKKSLSSKEGAAVPTDAGASAEDTTATKIVPEAPKSVAPSSAGAGGAGGRRGRNITAPSGAPVAAAAEAPAQPPTKLTPVAPPSNKPSGGPARPS